MNGLSVVASKRVKINLQVLNKIRITLRKLMIVIKVQNTTTKQLSKSNSNQNKKKKHKHNKLKKIVN